MADTSTSPAAASTSGGGGGAMFIDPRMRKPKRIYRYMEGFVSNEEREEHERAQARAAAEAAAVERETYDGEGGEQRTKRPRVKVARACIFCKRSHMSCNDQRPCTRCIMRGIGDRCCDTEQEAGSGGGGAANGNGNGNMAQQRERSHSSSSRSSSGSMTTAQDAAPTLLPMQHTNPDPVRMANNDTPGQTFDAMLAFLGNMDAATAEWGPGPSSSPFGNTNWLVDMTNPSPSATAAAAAAAPTLGPTSNIPRHVPSHSLRGPPAESPNASSTSSALANAAKIVSESLDSTNKPFISGRLAAYSASPQHFIRPWETIMHPSWSSTENPEDSIVRPYQYAYGYTRIERWIHSPLSGWSDESAARVKAVLDVTRPLLRSRWAVLSDLQLVQHEERHDAIVEHYRQNVCQAVPLPLFIIRRTCEIVCANEAFAKLCNCHPSVCTSGRLCLYQIIDQDFMVAIFEKMAEYLLQNAETPFVLRGQVRFSCAASSSQQSEHGGTDSVQLRRTCTNVILSMDPIMDEYGLPLAFACTFTPIDK